MYNKITADDISKLKNISGEINVLCGDEINPDYAGVEILKERIYKNGQPFLITFDFGDNVLSESNRILVYLNDQLAFNGTTLFWEENDEGEMELVELPHDESSVPNKSPSETSKNRPLTGRKIVKSNCPDVPKAFELNC